MRDFIDNIRKDRIIFYEITASFLILTITIVIVLLKFLSLPPYIPVFNQLPWGNDRLTNATGIFIPSLLFIFIYIFNILFALLAYKKNNPLLGRIIASITLLLSMMNFIFTLKIIFLVI